MKKREKIETDKVYIPKLMEGIRDEQLRQQIEHELYTYARRAVFYKRCYYILTCATIILPALVSVVNVVPSDSPNEIKLTVTILSAVSAVAAGVLGAANVHEHWTSYRSACENLKEEIFLYVKAVAPYDIDDSKERESKFVSNLLNLYHQENSRWKDNVRKKDEN